MSAPLFFSFFIFPLLSFTWFRYAVRKVGDPVKIVVRDFANILVPETRDSLILVRATPCARFRDPKAQVLPKVRIRLPRSRYFPGEIVRGVAAVQIRGNATELERLEITCEGYHRTDSWYTYSCGTNTCVAYVHEKHNFFCNRLQLQSGCHMEPGTFAFYFETALSTNLPPTSQAYFMSVGSSIK